MTSTFGEWVDEHGLPAFRYTADQRALAAAEWDPMATPPTRRHWVAVGNRRLQAVVDNEGGTALWETSEGLRWLVAPAPGGTGVTVVDGRPPWSTHASGWPSGNAPVRTIGPTWARVEVVHDGLSLARTVLCPEGDVPWVLARVAVTNLGASSRRVALREEWSLAPRFVSLFVRPERQDAVAGTVRYEVEQGPRGVVAREVYEDRVADHGGGVDRNHGTIGPPRTLVLEPADGAIVAAAWAVDRQPTVSLAYDLEVEPGATVVRWFRFGLDDGEQVVDGPAVFSSSLAALEARLPKASSPSAPFVAREVPWHAALLTGGAAVDRYLGGHTLDQASAYSFVLGFTGAPRDSFQHALPLVYIEPGLALSVLRNVCAWGAPSGELPYALDGAKQRWTWMFQPSDLAIWGFWLAAEYLAATGDVGGFAEPVPFHPTYGADPVPLHEHLRLHFRHFVDEIGVGEHGHVRMRRADWNDMAIPESEVDPEEMAAKGESVLNSAMAAWVLPRFAAACERLDDAATAAEARALGADLRARVAEAWNGRWFVRAFGGGRAVGDDDLWLEPQPWAVLCGAATDEQARQVLTTIDEKLRVGSPLGARMKWPARTNGEGTGGGIWFAISMTLVWAAARVMPELGWDELHRLSLTAHTAAYPDVWEGTVSGPDSYNAPEAERPGRTWAVPGRRPGMQVFPVNNLHSHAQPLLGYLRLLGVEPTPEGTLRVVGGGRFESPTFAVAPDGSGRLAAEGEVTVASPRGIVTGDGELTW